MAWCERHGFLRKMENETDGFPGLKSDGNSNNIFLGQFRLRDKGAMRLTLDKTLIRETRPDHNAGNSVPYCLPKCVDSLMSNLLQI